MFLNRSRQIARDKQLLLRLNNISTRGQFLLSKMQTESNLNRFKLKIKVKSPFDWK